MGIEMICLEPHGVAWRGGAVHGSAWRAAAASPLQTACVRLAQPSLRTSVAGCFEICSHLKTGVSGIGPREGKRANSMLQSGDRRLAYSSCSSVSACITGRGKVHLTRSAS